MNKNTLLALINTYGLMKALAALKWFTTSNSAAFRQGLANELKYCVDNEYLWSDKAELFDEPTFKAAANRLEPNLRTQTQIRTLNSVKAYVAEGKKPLTFTPEFHRQTALLVSLYQQEMDNAR